MFRKKSLANIDRRSFLKGLAVTVPLPLFDFFLNGNGTAYAQTSSPLPRRWLLVKSGNAPCWDGDDQRDITGNYRNLLVPLTLGAGYTLSPTTASLDALYPGLRNYVGFFSNCEVPYVTKREGITAGELPPGGYSGSFHPCENYTQMTGRKRWQFGADPDPPSSWAQEPGASVDQLLRMQLDPNGTRVHANYRVQDDGDCCGRGIMQYDAQGREIAPTGSPHAAFLQLFSNFTPQGAMPDPALERAKRKHGSVLDAIDKERLAFLGRELGPKEKAMLATHLDSIRDLEKRVTSPAITGAANPVCQKPNDPGANAGTDIVSRSDLMIELLAMAMACDIVRYGTFRITYDQSFTDAGLFTGQGGLDFHALTHAGPGTSLDLQSKAVSGVVGRYFKLVAALRALPEGGGNVLDNSVVVYTSEGGHGADADGGGNMHAAHSTSNMCTIISGKAGGIKTGAHVKLARAHMAQVFLSTMKAVGYVGNTVGDISGSVPEIY